MVAPLISAHRGGPEDMFAPNSIDAIRASAELGVGLIEFDVRVTGDGAFITYHDDGVVIDGKRILIQDLTRAQVLEHAPDAADVETVLDIIRGRAIGHVDLKDQRAELEIADLCESVLGPDGFVLTSLEDASIRRLRDERPHLKAALSLGRDAAGRSRLGTVALRVSEIFPGRRLRACRANMVALNYQIARLGAFRWARRHDLPVLLWTINDPERIRSTVHDDRYWAFTTDYPRLALQLRG